VEKYEKRNIYCNINNMFDIRLMFTIHQEKNKKTMDLVFGILQENNLLWIKKYMNIYQ